MTIRNVIKNIRDEEKISIVEMFRSGDIVSATVKGASGALYKCEIKNPEGEAKFYCSCPDFQFRWAYVLYAHNALLYPEKFVLEPPEKKNPGMVIGACKHISKVARAILEK